MANKHGSLSIDSENLFPIIKKWLERPLQMETAKASIESPTAMMKSSAICIGYFSTLRLPILRPHFQS